MERIVFKYELRPNEQPVVLLGGNAVIRHIDAVWDQIYVWVEHDVVGRSHLDFSIVPTGVKIKDPNLPFLGTVLMRDGRLVFHIYGAVRS